MLLRFALNGELAWSPAEPRDAATPRATLTSPVYFTCSLTTKNYSRSLPQVNCVMSFQLITCCNCALNLRRDYSGLRIYNV